MSGSTDRSPLMPWTCSSGSVTALSPGLAPIRQVPAGC